MPPRAISSPRVYRPGPAAGAARVAVAPPGSPVAAFISGGEGLTGGRARSGRFMGQLLAAWGRHRGVPGPPVTAAVASPFYVRPGVTSTGGRRGPLRYLGGGAAGPVAEGN